MPAQARMPAQAQKSPPKHAARSVRRAASPVAVRAAGKGKDAHPLAGVPGLNIPAIRKLVESIGGFDLDLPPRHRRRPSFR